MYSQMCLNSLDKKGENMENFGYIVVRGKETVRAAYHNGSKILTNKKDALKDFTILVSEDREADWFLCKIELNPVIIKEHRKVTKKKKKS